MRVFGYLEATKYGQRGVLGGLQRCCHLELTREVNRAIKTGFSGNAQLALFCHINAHC